MARVLVAMLFVGACITPQLVPCGDQLCPAGTVCVAESLCASPDQLAACDGAGDGSSCSLHGGVGRCDRGVCVPAGCGNAVVDPGEACDDGNVAGGDGCSADCGKVELCGDAVVDTGEGCDDGNLNSADGCDACVATAWHATSLLGAGLAAGAAAMIPFGVAVDLHGNVFIADEEYNRILRVAPDGVTTTVAGNGGSGAVGDGGPATSAELSLPRGVAVDGLGELYIADTNNHRIRKIDRNGVITTIVGDGTPDFTGDGGPAAGARINRPAAVAVDGLGNVYFTDTNNARIRMIDTNGIITTIAGNGSVGSGGDGGPATAASLYLPGGVSVDSAGTVYITDTWNHAVRRVDSTGTITRFAGTGASGSSGDGGPAVSARLSHPTGVAIDDSGRVCIVDSWNERVRCVVGGVIATFAGTGTRGSGGDGGPATAAGLSDPNAAAFGPDGTMYLADASNFRVRSITTSGTIATLVGSSSYLDAGDGGSALSAIMSATGVTRDGSGNIYIADAGNNRVRKVDAMGIITTVAGTGTAGSGGDGGPATSAQLQFPSGVALDGAGNLYIADQLNHRVRKVDTAGVISTFAGTGSAGSGGDGGPATSAQLSSPVMIAVAPAGGVYIADRGNRKVRLVTTAGTIVTFAGDGTVGSAGDGGPATAAQFNMLSAVALDGAGNLYVADQNANRVRRIDTAGTITAFAGTGSMTFAGDGGPAVNAGIWVPQGMAIDGQGNVWIAEYGNHRLRKVDSTGTISTVAGGGSVGGDGGPASAASFAGPHDVVLDGAGGVLIVDANLQTSVLRHVDAAGVITTVAGKIDPDGMGPLSMARLTDPRALVVSSTFTLFAGGTSGTIERARGGWLDVAAGRYPQYTATSALARYRDLTFGDVGGVAYDAQAGVIYVTETSANRLQAISLVDPADSRTWTIAPFANIGGTAGFGDGPVATAAFRAPTGLYLDLAAHTLYVADTGNHVIRAIDLAAGTVSTVVGTPEVRGFFGDDGPAGAALLFAPEAITRCGTNLFVADTSNHRVRRIDTTGTITTVLGDGISASAGEGAPASAFPVDAPRGLACDATGNLYVTSSQTVRMLLADDAGVIDGTGAVQSIFGGPQDPSFPANVTHCLTGIAVVDATGLQVTDACTGLWIELRRAPR